MGGGGKVNAVRKGGEYYRQGGGATGGRQKGDKRPPSDKDKRSWGAKKDVGLGRNKEGNELTDQAMGYVPLAEGDERLGWLINMHPVTIKKEGQPDQSGVDYYFIQQDGNSFRATLPHNPYFYVAIQGEVQLEVEHLLRRRFEGLIVSVEHCDKVDLDQANHLTGILHTLLKLSFRNTRDLIEVRKVLAPIVAKNRESLKTTAAYANRHLNLTKDDETGPTDFFEKLLDLREYDVPHYTRVSIDLDIRCGLWYNVKMEQSLTEFSPRPDILERAEPRICAFDIETTKLPLKFPDVSIDNIMMISYMVNGQGYLIVNRDIVSEDIPDFEYTPKPEYDGPFEVFNVPDEKALLEKWFGHMREIKPHIFVTFNGDFFDFPFIDARAAHHGLNHEQLLGFAKDRQEEYRSWFGIHMDAFCWVKRDSYLPQGSQGLKAVTKAKLGYDPLELDPEDMMPFAQSNPHTLAAYSVSDAVCTYYLYMKYVHPFIFSLCTIIPMGPDDVLRKGSGTLCEQLLMVEAFKQNIICPNKQVSELNKLYDGHYLASETYVGGHVEAIEAGVFRNDLPVQFRMDPDAYQGLMDTIDDTLKFALEVEGEIELDEVLNYDEVKQAVLDELAALRDAPKRVERPCIYHLDVSAMYPNIILTNRLQPSAMTNDELCASCDFNRDENNCKRHMEWVWRGEYMPATRGEYETVKSQLATELFPNPRRAGEQIPFHELSAIDQAAKIKSRLGEYSRKVYKKTHIVKPEKREATICQRENPFYVDTVRLFRDRRYVFKRKLKVWQKKREAAIAAKSPVEVKEASAMVVLFDSLQLAHKCILNSFYGYVMRRGARWYSMEMAGVVTHTGGNIIKQANKLISRIGRPLELDTDGIWCLLPSSFPENFTFKTTKKGKEKYTLSYPCTMLNVTTHRDFSNDQYQTLEDGEGAKSLTYSTKSECSIFFEVDGPYLAMVLPASQTEGKKLKKRYAVFDFDGTLAELKGFEVKRRGELKLIKIFQQQIFSQFLIGTSLEECYQAVGATANHWLGILESKGCDLDDTELFELIGENRNMSKSLEEYGAQKSTAITSAKRMGEFLGDSVLGGTRGLACNLVVSHRPVGAPVSERAIPIAIFSASEAVKKHYLRKWLKDPTRTNFDIRTILDWDYYKGRLGSAVQKIITIPAALQNIGNPCPTVKHPDWLRKEVRNRNDSRKQRSIGELFGRQGDAPKFKDIEDMMGPAPVGASLPTVTKTKGKRKKNPIQAEEEAAPATLPDRHNDFDNWLLFEKSKWRKQIAERKRAKKGMMPIGSSRGASRHGAWEIIQLAETEIPGEYTLWAMVGQEKLHRVALRVPRIFYVNSRSESTDMGAENKVSKVLPHNRPVHHLYEVCLDEVEYQDGAKMLNSALCSEEILGVYETQVPLDFRAILSVGCVTRPRPQHRNKKLRDQFTLDELSFVTTTEASYLRHDNLKQVYLYHSFTDKREIYGLFNGSEATVVVVKPGQKRRNEQQVNLAPIIKSNIIRKAVLQLTDDQDDPFPPMDLQVKRVKDTKAAHKELNNVLTRYATANRPNSQGSAPTALLVQAADPKALSQAMPSMEDFPVIPIPANSKDNRYSSLQWEESGVTKMMKRYWDSARWYHDAIQFANFCHAPVGNLPAHPTSYAADLFFARHLQKHNHLLWISDSSKPDLGGEDNYSDIFMTENINPELAIPGAYRNVCAELDLTNLAVNAILKSQFVAEGEGGMAMAFDAVAGDDTAMEIEPGEILTETDEALSVAQTFKHLKVMVSTWFRETSVNQNPYTDLLLMQFYRWMHSPTSKLYDPALFRILHKLMQKVFMQLIGDLEQLGCRVVYASFNRVILDTGKTKPSIASTYTKAVIQTMGKKEVFKLIDLIPHKFWYTYLFMDRANYGGIVIQSTINGLTGVADVELTDEEIAENVLTEDNFDASWNINEHLPQKVQQFFTLSIYEFLRRPLIQALEHQLENQENLTPLPKVSKSKSAIAIRDLVREDLSQRLFSFVPAIANTLAGDQRAGDELASEFPRLAGSHLPLHNPALEFVKTVCQVLSLDKECAVEVAVLRKALLKQIHIREFAPEALFKNPSLSLVLPDVICDFCNHCSDIDLCRDSRLLDDPDKDWECENEDCSQIINKARIEEALVANVNRLLLGYQVQDLKCKKCRQVKVSQLHEHCTCSGVYHSVQSPDDIETLLKPYLAVAKFHRFEWLLDTVSWALGPNASMQKGDGNAMQVDTGIAV